MNASKTAVEPRIHSHIEDSLPEDHPLAFEAVSCDGNIVTHPPHGDFSEPTKRRCNELLHAANNECMRTWVETGIGNFCWSCAGRTLGNVLGRERLMVEDDKIERGKKIAKRIETETVASMIPPAMDSRPSQRWQFDRLKEILGHLREIAADLKRDGV